MKIKAMIFMTAVVVSMVTSCCERRCGVARLKSPELESVSAQQKLTKMKEQTGGKGSK
jgi:uncharacterized Fe-S radical SAM superfamily protein PflX